MTPVTNNDILHDEEENNPGHEIILRSLPNENEMAAAAANHANHPEEEPDADEDEQPFSYGHWCPAWSRSRALTALLGAAGVGAAVGTASVVFRAAGAGGNKPSTTITSNMQVANVLAPAGYEVVGNVGDGVCADGNSQLYPNVQYKGIATADACADKCNECVAEDFTFVGMQHNPTLFDGFCACFVSQTDPNVDLSQINNIGGCEYTGAFPSNPGTGQIAGTNSNSGWTCYRYVGGGSKAGKSPKAPKRG